MYENTFGWQDFGTIIDDLHNDDTSVGGVTMDNNLPQLYYNLNGLKVANDATNLPSGIYIVRQGSMIKKVFVK